MCNGMRSVGTSTIGSGNRPSSGTKRSLRGAGGARAVSGSGFTELADAFFRPAVNALTPYQPGKPVEDVQRELGLDRVVKLASNEGPFGPFPAAADAIASGIPDLNRSPDGGAYRLHAALAERHGVDIAEIVVGAGADGCIDMLSQAILDPGDE